MESLNSRRIDFDLKVREKLDHFFRSFEIEADGDMWPWKGSFMGTLKSQSDVFYVVLFEKLLSDLSSRYPSETKSFKRDFETIKSRVANEGLSFLTKTLPKLGKAFDGYLETNNFEIPQEFSYSKRNPQCPAFLQGIFKLCFGPSGSRGIRPGVVRDIRQILFLAYKLEIPYSESTSNRVLRDFVETENEIRAFQWTASFDELSSYRSLIEGVLSDFNPKEITPRHGPGAVATGEKLEQKWEFSRLYSSIHQEFPYYDYFMVGRGRELIDRVKWYFSLERCDTGQAKVVLVPKDSRGPRLISCEPLEYQWIQQGVGRALMRHLERHRLTKGHINFIDQSVNAELALFSSNNRKFCTIDMKEASDRVSLDHIDLLFPERIRNVLRACRTSSTRLPDGSDVPLHKFAPMGSALCFPVEALVFWSICVGAVARQRSLTAQQASQLVFVYGDDIIIPTDTYESTCEALESVGLSVNRSKCFVKGFFRESCGMDAYKGLPVTPIRLRTLWSETSSDGTMFASYVAYANSFSAAGYSGTSQFLFSMIESVFGRLPYGTPEAGYQCRHCHSGLRALVLNLEQGFQVRWNIHSHQPEVRAKFLQGKTSHSTLDGWTRLLRNMVSPSSRDPSLVALPRSAKVKFGWRRVC